MNGKWRDRRVLVTGAAGFIGTAVCCSLVSEGAQVVAVDARQAGEDFPGEGCLFFQLDLCDRIEMEKLLKSAKPEIIIHLAGQTGVVQSIRDPDSFFRSNVEATESLLLACRAVPVSQVVCASSVAVYGDTGRTAREQDVLPEPGNPYAAGKQSMECLAKEHAEKYGIPVTILRLFTVYGPGQKSFTAIYRFIEQLMQGEPLSIFGDGQARRDFLYIDDAVRGILLAAERTFPWEVINLGSGMTVTLDELVEQLGTAMNKPVRRGGVETPPGISRGVCADISRAHDLLGFFPAVPLAEGLRRTVGWFKNLQDRGGTEI